MPTASADPWHFVVWGESVGTVSICRSEILRIFQVLQSLGEDNIFEHLIWTLIILTSPRNGEEPKDVFPPSVVEKVQIEPAVWRDHEKLWADMGKWSWGCVGYWAMSRGHNRTLVCEPACRLLSLACLFIASEVQHSELFIWTLLLRAQF